MRQNIYFDISVKNDINITLPSSSSVGPFCLKDCRLKGEGPCDSI